MKEANNDLRYTHTDARGPPAHHSKIFQVVMRRIRRPFAHNYEVSQVFMSRKIFINMMTHQVCTGYVVVPRDVNMLKNTW
jgi:hypothetical protein